MSGGFDDGFQDMAGNEPGDNNHDFEQIGYESQAQGTIPEQDEEISTTNNFGGEEQAEEDRYAAGASDAAPSTNPNPLISWGDEDDEILSQPSAAVPDSQSSALDDLSAFAMGSLSSAGAQAQSALKSTVDPLDPLYSVPPCEGETAVTSTEPVSEAHHETKPSCSGKCRSEEKKRCYLLHSRV
jgi:hypothetical protein